jgi:hypothetical protein
MRLVGIIAAALGLLLVAVVVGWKWYGARTGRQPDNPAVTAADDAGADWRAEVALEQLSEQHPGYDISRLTVVLRNSKGKEIETPDTQFAVNGVPLRYVVGQGNYYDRHPYYRLREDSGFGIAADTAYELTMQRANGPASPFARVRTPAPMLPTSFRVPVTHPSNRDLVVAWTGLRQPAELLIYKTHTLIDAQGNQTIEAGGPYADDALRQRIGSGGLPEHEGTYTIPATYFAASAAGRVSALSIEITAANSGQFLHPVLRQSTVTAHRKIVLRIDVTAPQER